MELKLISLYYLGVIGCLRTILRGDSDDFCLKPEMFSGQNCLQKSAAFALTKDFQTEKTIGFYGKKSRLFWKNVGRIPGLINQVDKCE